MAQEVVFDTEGDCDTRRTADDAEFMTSISGASAAYKAVTTCWVKESRARNDGKFTFIILPGADYSGETVETFDESNYV